MSDERAPRGLYADAPESLEPPTGRRGVRGPSGALLCVLVALACAAIAYHLGAG